MRGGCIQLGKEQSVGKSVAGAEDLKRGVDHAINLFLTMAGEGTYTRRTQQRARPCRFGLLVPTTRNTPLAILPSMHCRNLHCCSFTVSKTTTQRRRKRGNKTSSTPWARFQRHPCCSVWPAPCEIFSHRQSPHFGTQQQLNKHKQFTPGRVMENFWASPGSVIVAGCPRSIGKEGVNHDIDAIPFAMLKRGR